MKEKSLALSTSGQQKAMIPHTDKHCILFLRMIPMTLYKYALLHSVNNFCFRTDVKCTVDQFPQDDDSGHLFAVLLPRQLSNTGTFCLH